MRINRLEYPYDNIYLILTMDYKNAEMKSKL